MRVSWKTPYLSLPEGYYITNIPDGIVAIRHVPWLHLPILEYELDSILSPVKVTYRYQ